MQIREYSLPAGWYPRDLSSISDFLTGFSTSSQSGRAVIAPHAGWYYSGKIAARAVSSLQRAADTIVVLGGHLSAGMKPLFAMEDAVRTPFGAMPIDSRLRLVLRREFGGNDDRYSDNTIEVLLPMVHYFFPKASLLWVRLPSDLQSAEAGKIISGAAKKLNLNINVIASTDLTHYGPNYGFSPQGTGLGAIRWVREVNDAGFINAVESGNNSEVLRSAESNHAACSAGAVLGVMGFTGAESLGNLKLLEYGTSADVDEGSSPASFVGYAALVV